MSETTSVVWHKAAVLSGVKVLQAYIFALTNDNQIILVRDEDETRFTLPGGGIEANETPEQGIQRELMEEAQVAGKDLILLGSIEVKIYDEKGELVDYHQQIRYACRVEHLGDFIPRKDGFETVERIHVDIFDIPAYIPWMKKPNGMALFGAFLEFAAKV